MLWENAAGGIVDDADEETREELAEARERWEEEYGDPARLLLDKLHTLLAISETDETIRLTPLALAALHEQLVEAGVEIPLLPPTAAELTGAELLAMAEGVSDTEFEAEAAAWAAVPRRRRGRPGAARAGRAGRAGRADARGGRGHPRSAHRPRRPARQPAGARRSAATPRSRCSRCPASTT